MFYLRRRRQARRFNRLLMDAGLLKGFDRQAAVAP